LPVANRIEAFAVTVTAGTAKTSAATTDVSFLDGIVQRIELDVPDGHFGLTGIQILSAHAQAIPYTFGDYIVADGHDFGWDLVGQIDTGSWQVKCFNTDVYDHTFYLRFSVLDFAYAPSTAPLPALAPTPVLV
jgi:hypothetical protein